MEETSMTLSNNTKKILLVSILFSISISAHAMLPEHVALVDTGYDQCILSGGTQCEQNKNLLMRGGIPIPDDAPYIFSFEEFRASIFDYLKDFKNTFSTRAALPESIDDLKNYRIVDIDLIYDFNQQGGNYEYFELVNEFKDSGNVSTLQLPEQHKMYGLNTPFDPAQFAFEWWPVTFAELADTDPQFIPMSINWPGIKGTPPHQFEPREYKFLDFPYLITSIPLSGVSETAEAKDLVTLLKTIPQDGHPLLIYYHCIAGKDRTGAVSISYFMKHGGYPYFTTVSAGQKHFREAPTNLALALKYTTLPDRHPWFDAVALAKAYCLTLGKGYENCAES